ncbi:hypothetical protein HCJ92_17420, partial [Streptomyces sp. ventii]|nr:hypothetical protein [Streptomyces spiramenti]
MRPRHAAAGVDDAARQGSHPLATGLAFLLPALVTATATQATARLSG